MTTPSTALGRLAVIGGGNMGEAIVRGALACGILQPAGIVVVDPAAERRRIFEAMSIRTTDSIGTCIRDLAGMMAHSMERGAILLAVKPQMMLGVAKDLSPALRDHFKYGIPVLSILAGMPLSRLHTMLGEHARLVRAMPNLPARIRQGATALCFGPTTTHDDQSLARELFESIGPTVVRIDESLMDAFTALAGSGPAYLFFLAEAMTRSARELGFDDATAASLVRQTLLGSAMLLAESSDDPSVLRAAVTSKGGTTAAAVDVLDHAGAMQTWIHAMRAARDRGAELARGD
jgi:pyrroline-5-carboxylate reductase